MPDEIARLRARVAELEAELAATPPAAPTGAPPARPRWWAASSAILLTLACVLAPLSVTAVWASTQVSDTDAYVETVAPLAEDPALRRAVANEVTRAVVQELDLEGLTTEALDALAAQENIPPRVAAALPALSVPITNGVESFTRDQVRNVLASDQFAQVWAQVNRLAHEQVITLLEGNQGGVVSAQGDTVTLNLAPVIEEVKDRLVARGFTLAANIPTVDRSFVLVESEAVTNAQGAYRLLNTLGFWLPIIALALFAVGVFLARDRRRALMRGALGVVAAMVVMGIALSVFRVTYVESTPAGLLTEQAAGSVFDTLVRFLRTGLRAAAVLGILVALGAVLAGPSTAAARTRAMFQGGMGSLRGSAEQAGWHPGRVGTWTFAHRQALRAAALVAGGLLLMFWTMPTAWVVVWIAVVVVLLLALVEFLGTPPAPVPTAAAADPGSATNPDNPVPAQRQATSAEPPAPEPLLPASPRGPESHG